MAKNKQKEYLKVLETVVFSLLIIVVVFANSYGSIYIRMIPLLFILGIVGNLFFGRAVITTIFGIITSICVVHLKEKYGFFENIFVSFNFGLNIALGECAGKLIKNAYILMGKNSKKLKKKKLALYILTIIFLFVACPIIHGVINGNLLRYTRTKEKLDNYLKSEYGNESDRFYIKDAEYKLGKNTHYVFKVNYNENIYNFTVYVNDDLDIIDGYKQYILEKNNKKIKSAFDLFADSINIDDLEIKFDEKAKNIFLTYNLDNNQFGYEENINKIVEDIDTFKKFIYINDINKMDISIKNKETLQIESNATIDVNKYISLENVEEKKLYINNAFLIEYMDNDI